MLTYQVSEPEQLIDMLREFRPDMVLMDMYLPNCNGRDLAKGDSPDTGLCRSADCFYLPRPTEKTVLNHAYWR